MASDCNHPDVGNEDGSDERKPLIPLIPLRERDTLTISDGEDIIHLSSDDEEEYLQPCNDQAVNNDATNEAPVDLMKLSDSMIDQSIACSLQESQEEFNRRCQNLESENEFLKREILNIAEEFEKIKQISEKFTIKETVIGGVGIINERDQSLSVEEPVQRIVRLNTIKREVSEDVPANDAAGFINLGVLPTITDDPEIDIVPMTTDDSIRKALDLPMRGAIERKPLKVGDKVYAVTDTQDMAKNPWEEATITEAWKFNGKNHYQIYFDADTFRPGLFLRGNQLAYRESPTVLLQNMTRVLAVYQNDPRSKNPGRLYPGVIAEVPKRVNTFRYLVFFDNGGFAYVRHDQIHLIVETGLIEIDGAPEEHKPFLRKYFKDYPERAMVKFQVKSKEKVLINGKWTTGKVKEIDCSLVKFYFRSLDQYQWIYRGSPRLRPLADISIEKAVQPMQQGKQRAIRKGTARRPLYQGGKPRPFVQYTIDENISENDSKFDVKTRPRSDFSRRTTPTEFELYPELFIKPERKYKTKMYVPHRCGPECIKGINESIAQFRDVNPYAIPVIYGWERQVASYTALPKRMRKNQVFYVGPCGRRFRSIEEVDKYLFVTKSRLSIDLFTFHGELKLYSELDGKTFQGCYYYEPDVTAGTENHSISCINFINDEHISSRFQYSATRFPASGVNLNLNTDFLVSCDCQDNCRDASKCQCHQLTEEAYNSLAAFLDCEDESGYKYRKLNDPRRTGIWECNANCSCDENCANRVVQNGIRVRLQIFRTLKKGWGIRALHDIPPGTFICIYAAQLLNDEEAEEEGTAFGDEYLAALDFIEIIEEIKEGYESAVEETISSDESNSSDDDDEETRPTRSSNRSKKKKSENGKKSKKAAKTSPKVKPGKKIRECFGENFIYSLDARERGNVGRYFNHSCDPNCFVQNVFIDTHDLRFPWVALFSEKFIPAFTELTWDYNYSLIDERKTRCYCGTSLCRGRLL